MLVCMCLCIQHSVASNTERRRRTFKVSKRPHLTADIESDLLSYVGKRERNKVQNHHQSWNQCGNKTIILHTKSSTRGKCVCSNYFTQSLSTHLPCVCACKRIHFKTLKYDDPAIKYITMHSIHITKIKRITFKKCLNHS